MFNSLLSKIFKTKFTALVVFVSFVVVSFVIYCLAGISSRYLRRCTIRKFRRRRRIRNCMWTARKVMWQQRKISRTFFISLALRSLEIARRNEENSVIQKRQRIRGTSSKLARNRPQQQRSASKEEKQFVLTSALSGLGTECRGNNAGDGPRKRNIDNEEYDPDYERVKKRKLYNSRRSKASIKASNLKQNPKRTQADRQKIT